MPNQLNSKGKETALSKIRAGDVDETSDWSFGADDENALLGDPPDWDRYSSWHMGIDPDTAEETKERFKYPFGKDGKVYRSALRAIRSRAAQQGEQEISDAARDCMDEMDMMHEGEDGSKNVRRGRAWYSLTIARSQGGEQTEADLRVFDVIGQSFWGEETVTAKQFIADLMALPQSVKTIRVHVNSPGGDVFDAVAIANALKGHPARIEMTIEGLAASAATIVTMAGDVISIAENALMMIHNPWSIVIGGADDMRKEAEALDRVRDSIVATDAADDGATRGASRCCTNASRSAPTCFDSREIEAWSSGGKLFVSSVPLIRGETPSRSSGGLAWLDAAFCTDGTVRSFNGWGPRLRAWGLPPGCAAGCPLGSSSGCLRSLVSAYPALGNFPSAKDFPSLTSLRCTHRSQCSDQPWMMKRPSSAKSKNLQRTSESRIESGRPGHPTARARWAMLAWSKAPSGTFCFPANPHTRSSSPVAIRSDQRSGARTCATRSAAS